MVVLAIFPNPDQAHLLRSHLGELGIRTEITGEYTAQNAPYLSVLGGGVCILVDPADFQAAMEALRSDELLGYSPWSGAECPACGSLKVEWTRTYWKEVPWALFIGSLFLFGIPLLLRRKALHCVDCGALWRA